MLHQRCPASRRHPVHLMMFLLAEEDKSSILHIVEECNEAYLAAFVISYTGGLLFGIYSLCRVMFQYKKVTQIRQSKWFKVRNRILAAVESETTKMLVQSLTEEKGFLRPFMSIP